MLVKFTIFYLFYCYSTRTTQKRLQLEYQKLLQMNQVNVSQ